MGFPDEREQLQFLFKIQRLLGEGSFTASYKFALLNALADIAVEKGHDTWEPHRISLEDIAEKFIQYYWPQSVPYPSQRGTIRIIQQNTDRQAEIIRHLVEARKGADVSLARIKLNKPAYRRLVKTGNAFTARSHSRTAWRLTILSPGPGTRLTWVITLS